MPESKVDKQAFRSALGKFPTGVTIITCKNDEGELIGMTASSFNSVSLDPPLVLWSVDKSARSAKAFTDSYDFAVHVLADDQQEISNLFARQGVDKFAEVEITECDKGVPLLENYCARFRCTMEHQYEGGDHIIIVGRVIDFESTDKQPLIFHSGRYGKVVAY